MADMSLPLVLLESLGAFYPSDFCLPILGLIRFPNNLLN